MNGESACREPRLTVCISFYYNLSFFPSFWYRTLRNKNKQKKRRKNNNSTWKWVEQELKYHIADLNVKRRDFFYRTAQKRQYAAKKKRSEMVDRSYALGLFDSLETGNQKFE